MMRFKEFFLLRESPDIARFTSYEGKSPQTFEYWQGGYSPKTIVSDESCVISVDTAIATHTDVLRSSGRILKLNGNIPSRYTLVGKISDKMKDAFIKCDEQTHTRSSALENFPFILQSRCWDLPNDSVGISFWNARSSFNKENIAMIVNYLKTLYDINIARFEVEDVEYNIDGFRNLANTNDSSSNYKPEESPLHLMSPEKKKAELLARGVRPKAVVPLQQRIRRDGD